MPTLLEIRTYRFMGHSMSDAVSGTYRTKEELEQYLKRDPIALLRTRMEDDGDLDRAGLERHGRRDQGRSCRTPSTSPSRARSRLSRALMADVLVDTTSD